MDSTYHGNGKRARRRDSTALVTGYYLITRQATYEDLGGDYFDNRRKESKINYYLSQLHKLGYSTQIEPQPLAP
jgi:hypothetical protein